MRDLPYDYTTLVENIIDPSHVPVSHHGTSQVHVYVPMIVLYVISHHGTSQIPTTHCACTMHHTTHPCARDVHVHDTTYMVHLKAHHCTL